MQQAGSHDGSAERVSGVQELEEDPRVTQSIVPAHDAQLFVLERVFQGGVHVAAIHPALGAVYWMLIDDTDVGMGRTYRLTTNRDEALRLPTGWRDNDWHRGHAWNFERDLYETEIHHQDVELFGPPSDGMPYEGCDLVHAEAHLQGSLALLAHAANQRTDAFLEWLFQAQWQDVPAAAPTVRYLQDMNGFVGYAPVWTDNITEALTFDKEDPELDMLRGYGRLVPYLPAARS